MRPTRTPTPDTNREAYILRAHRLRFRTLGLKRRPLGWRRRDFIDEVTFLCRKSGTSLPQRLRS
jgi:hypothetical protein